MEVTLEVTTSLTTEAVTIITKRMMRLKLHPGLMILSDWIKLKTSTLKAQ